MELGEFPKLFWVVIMKKPPKPNPLIVKCGSSSVTIYHGESGGSPLYTLVWREGRKRYRKAFRQSEKAIEQANVVVKRLESGHRTAGKISNADAEAFGIAMIDLAPLKVPLNSVAQSGGTSADQEQFSTARCDALQVGS